MRMRERMTDVLRLAGRTELDELLQAATLPPAGQREHLKLFTAWLRRPTDERRAQELKAFEASHTELKDVTVGAGVGGGFAVPEEIAREIDRLEKQHSPVRELVRVARVDRADYSELVNIRGGVAAWIAETGTRVLGGTAQFRARVPTFGELYAYVEASEWALDDIAFDVEAWLAEEAADEFARAEGLAVVAGDGVTKPTGMLNTAPVSTADFASPLRAPAAYQFIASDLTPGGSGILADALVDLVHALNKRYRPPATFTMNSDTALATRKLKDTAGRYLWSDGLAGAPDRLLGYPVAIWEDLPDIGANQHPVFFGDFRRGYVLADRVGPMRITRDELTRPGYARFYLRRRVGGTVRNNDAIKILKVL